MKTLDDLLGEGVTGRRVLVRADLNVPFDKSQPGVISDDGRIRAVLPTLIALRDAGARVIVMSHLGRPKGEPDPKYTLAPVAVLPEHQRRGVGGRLIRYGLELLRARGEKITLVVGHPDYYPRFGFSTQKARSLESPFPAEAFMAIELSAGALDGVQGSVVYPAAFGI